LHFIKLCQEGREENFEAKTSCRITYHENASFVITCKSKDDSLDIASTVSGKDKGDTTFPQLTPKSNWLTSCGQIGHCTFRKITIDQSYSSNSQKTGLYVLLRSPRQSRY
jgi:hypothetical protein